MICRRVLVIHDGRIVADDEPANLSDRLRRHERIEVSITADDGAREVMRTLRDLPMIIDVRRDSAADAAGRGQDDGLISLIVDARPDREATQTVARTVVEKDWGLVKLQPMPMSLEEIFLELTTDESLDA